MTAGGLYWIIILASRDTYGGWVSTYKRSRLLESESTDEGKAWTYEQPEFFPGAVAVYGTPAGS